MQTVSFPTLLPNYKASVPTVCTRVWISISSVKWADPSQLFLFLLHPSSWLAPARKVKQGCGCWQRYGGPHDGVSAGSRQSRWSSFSGKAFIFKKKQQTNENEKHLAAECTLVILAQYLPEEAEVNKACRRMERGSQELLSIGQVVIILLAMFPHSKQRKRLIGQVSCRVAVVQFLIDKPVFI